MGGAHVRRGRLTTAGILLGAVLGAVTGFQVPARGMLQYPQGWTRVRGQTITFCASAQDPAFEVHRDVARAVARLMGLKHEFRAYQEGDRDGRPMLVRREEFVILLTDYCDVFLGTPVSTTPTFDRPADEETLSTVPYFVTSFVFASRTPSYTSLSSVPPGKPIGAEFSSLPAMLLTALRGGIYPLRLFDTPADLVEALLRGQVVGIVIWAPHLYKLVGAPEKQGLHVGAVTELPGMEWAVSGTVLRERTSLRVAVDEALKKLWTTGQIGAILERHGFVGPFFRQPEPGFVPVDEM